MEKSLHLSSEEQKIISRLLRMRYSGDEMDHATMIEYLMEKYKIAVKFDKKKKKSNQLYKLLHETYNDNGMNKPENINKWRNFIDEERDLLNKSMYEDGSLDGAKNKIDFDSVFKLIRETDNSKECIFFNTYINMHQWHSPIIQMHLCIQKSIEQQNNFNSVHHCHSLAHDAKKRGSAIIGCTDNPPMYKHYRILLLPFTTDEFKEYLKDNNSFLENFRFSTLMHCCLSIQLGIVTLTDLEVIIRNNIDFFSDVQNLKQLGLNTDIAKIFDPKYKVNTEVLLKESIEKMGKIPTQHQETGLDFMCVNTNDKKHHIWTAHNSNEKGLTYKRIENDKCSDIKKKFTSIVFDKVVEESLAHKNEHSILDPLHKFYSNGKDRKFLRFIDKHNAIVKARLS